MVRLSTCTRLAGLAVVLAMAVAAPARAAEYYVDVESKGGPAADTNPGSLTSPWKTLGRAVGDTTPRPGPGDTVWIRGGTYKEQISLARGGTAAQPLTFKAFTGEKPLLDGEGAKSAIISLPKAGQGDYLVFDGLTIHGGSGAGILAQGRRGLDIRNMNISGTGQGIWISFCADSRIAGSDVGNCNTPVLIDSGCTNLVIEDNQIHHSRRGHALSIYAPGDGTRAQAAVASIAPAGPGLAIMTTKDVDLSKVRDGSLFGQDAAGTVQNPSLLLFFAEERNPQPNGQAMAGGTVTLMDGRKWFVMRNNPDWGNKPYSKDGKQALFEVGKANLTELAAAKWFYTAYLFPSNVTNKDIIIRRNEVHHGHTQGLWVQRSEGVLIQDNVLHDNGATGIQIEAMSRNIWIERNTSYANNAVNTNETGMWMDENMDCVVQDNRMYENQKGLGITQCHWVIARRNFIFNNAGQHVAADKREGQYKATLGVWFSGGRNSHLGAPAGGGDNAFVHNTLYRNGADTTQCGSIDYGYRAYPQLRGSALLNNLVQEARGKAVMVFGVPAGTVDGNIYSAASGPARVRWADADTGKETTFDLSDPAGFAAYRKTAGTDAHSLVAKVEFVNPDKQDFHPAAGSAAVDAGVPLARAVSEGKGRRIAVDSVVCFSAGFRTGKGEQLIPGDDILIGGKPARVTAVDKDAKALVLDREVEWQKDAPLNYKYDGRGPDVGAIESK